ncbi:MAG TPA: hypothetical protein VGQ37_14980 [Vicinamibacterales bacterium]|nr:hypothetical protein [Vicinamibacterales bacterium]
MSFRSASESWVISDGRELASADDMALEVPKYVRITIRATAAA